MSYPITPSEQRKADEFFGLLGRCITRWSELEFVSGGLFFRVTKLKPKQAKAIFHSGRNWRTKTGMLDAAIETASLPPGMAKALTSIVDRSRSYSNFRNVIAHNMVQLEPAWRDRGVSQRELCFRPHDASLDHIYDAGAIRSGELANGEKNFSLLTAIMSLVLSRPHTDQLAAPERLSLLVASLPADAHLKPPSPSEEAQILLGVTPLHFPK